MELPAVSADTHTIEQLRTLLDLAVAHGDKAVVRSAASRIAARARGDAAPVGARPWKDSQTYQGT